MDQMISNFLSKMEFGELKIYNNMGAIPLFTTVNHGPQYLTLKEALDQRLLTITEVSQGGSVPELKVVNKAEIPVLLLDGEELAGAKQNRVLNTTILLKEKSETIIPVSCTEQGRWAYASREFSESGHIMNRNIRSRKVSSVSHSLREGGRFSGDQGDVWDGIAHFAMAADVHSPTGAMREVFESREEDLKGYLDAFQYVPHQKGILVMVNGKVAGFDILSLSQAYEKVHQKLVKSYAMDAVLQKKSDNEASMEKAKSFIEEATLCEEKRYESIGHGWDHRFEGKTVVGSSLVYQDKVIHMAFFRADDTDRIGNMSAPSRRRRFRIS
ncbi:MAG: hypothetical protein FJ123_04360 [Deltaproteobacteria bacterium]|nr:hypothetical protein [Deltaproteobacteria bacterium]